MGSKSKSSSEQTSNVTDRRIGATDSAIVVAEGSSFTPNVVTNYHVTDGGAMAAGASAFQSAGKIAEKALTEAFGFGNKTLELTHDVVSDSYMLVDHVVEGAFDSILDVNARSLESIKISNNALRDVSDQAIEKVLQATRSDAAEAFNNLVKYATLGAAIVAVAVMIRR